GRRPARLRQIRPPRRRLHAGWPRRRARRRADEKGRAAGPRRWPLVGLLRRLGVRAAPSGPPRAPGRHLRLALRRSADPDRPLGAMRRWARVPGVGEALYATFYRNAIGERLYLNFVDPNMVTQRVVDEVERQMALDGALAAALAAARGMHRFAETEAEYRSIKHPTLLVWGRDDRVSRVAFGERLARDLPHAQLVVLPRCGH